MRQNAGTKPNIANKMIKPNVIVNKWRISLEEAASMSRILIVKIGLIRVQIIRKY